MNAVARGLSDGLIYHVINRGNGRQEVFHKSEDYRAFVDLIGEAKVKFPLKLYAYCLMPNHFHLLLSPGKGDDLSRWMQTVVRYIEGNPLRAQLATSAGQWNWSSHRARLNAENLQDELPIKLPEDRTQTVDMPLTENELEKMQRSVDRQTPFGGLSRQQRVCGELGLESTIRSKGRPMKWGGKVACPLFSPWTIISEGGRQSWALQEKFKGKFRLPLVTGSNYGGWSYNLADYGVVVADNGQASIVPLQPLYANNISVEQLRTKPFFAKGVDDSALFAEFTGSNYAMRPEVRNRLLVEAIPARTLAAGRQAVGVFGPNDEFNFNMHSRFKNGWPPERINNNDDSWKHNDFIRISYPYIYLV